MFHGHGWKEDNGMDTKRFGQKIAALRKKKGFTQAQLAEKINVSNKTISRWETGEGYPEISLLKPLAAALETTVDELLSSEEDVEIQSAPKNETEKEINNEAETNKSSESNKTANARKKNFKYEEIPVDMDALKSFRFKAFWASLTIFNQISLLCLITCLILFIAHIALGLLLSDSPVIVTFLMFPGGICNIGLVSSIIGVILGVLDCYKRQIMGSVVFGVLCFVGRMLFPWLAVVVNMLFIS